MKYTDRELEDILNKLIASTRSPRGRFSAASSYPQLEKKLNFRNHRLYLTRTVAAAAAVVLCVYRYGQLICTCSRQPYRLLALWQKHVPSVCPTALPSR